MDSLFCMGMNYKNDISFVFDFELMLYEHQSSVNPNMPLRDLIYVTKVLQGRIKGENLYGTVLVRTEWDFRRVSDKESCGGDSNEYI